MSCMVFIFRRYSRMEENDARIWSLMVGLFCPVLPLIGIERNKSVGLLEISLDVTSNQKVNIWLYWSLLETNQVTEWGIVCQISHHETGFFFLGGGGVELSVLYESGE
jgi:hypothetical protein